MSGATLVAMSQGQEMSFVLQLPDDAGASAMQASVRLRIEQRARIKQVVSEFAECRVGFHKDEKKLQELGEILFAMILPEFVRVHLTALEQPLTILTNDPTLPWEILHDGADFLVLRLPVARRLIIQRGMGSLLRPPRAEQQGFAALVIADPTADLPGARTEGLALKRYFDTKGHCDLLLGRVDQTSRGSVIRKVPDLYPEASAREIQRCLIGRAYSVIHYCGHLDYDAERGEYSLRLRDELLKDDRLFIEDVLSLFKGHPIVFLNACYSDLHIDANIASNRIESFAQAFMIGSANGVADAVISTMWRIPDEPEEAGPEFSLALYQRLFARDSLGEAMRSARAMAREKEWGPMVWGPYVLYGDPALLPFQPYEQHVPKGQPPNRQEQPPESQSGAERLPEGSGQPGVAALDSAARRVLRLALREMSLLNHGMLSSMHLLLGLCADGVDAPVLGPLMLKKGVNPESLCQAARTRATAMIPTQDQLTSGISENAAHMFLLASSRASSFGRTSIGADDLLAGLVQRSDSEAVSILASFGISPIEVRAILPPLPPPLPFDRVVRGVVKHAIKVARSAGLPFLATPHLMIGLVRAGGTRTLVLLQERNVDLDLCCELLERGVGTGAATTSSEATLESSP